MTNIKTKQKNYNNYENLKELQIVLRNEEVYECLTKEEKDLKNLLSEGVIAKYQLNTDYEITNNNSNEKIKNINNKDDFIVLTSDGELSLLTYDSKKYDYEYISLENMTVKEKTFNNSFNLSNSKDKRDLVSIVKEFNVLDIVCDRLQKKLKNYFSPDINTIPSYRTTNPELLNERNKVISLIQNLSTIKTTDSNKNKEISYTSMEM